MFAGRFWRLGARLRLRTIARGTPAKEHKPSETQEETETSMNEKRAQGSLSHPRTLGRVNGQPLGRVPLRFRGSEPATHLAKTPYCQVTMLSRRLLAIVGDL